MSFIQSILEYGDSIIKVCSGYLISIIIFSLYNRRSRRVSNVDVSDRRIAVWEKLLWRFLTIFPVAYTAGIRGYITGADTQNVWYRYIHSQDMSLAENLNSDIGSILYVIIRYFTAKITDCNVQVFLFLWAFFTMYFVILGIEKWKIKYAGFSLFIFYSFLGLQLFGQMRQLMAVAIIFYAYYFVFYGNLKTFWMLALIAGFIHPSAWVSAFVIWYLVVFRDKHHVVFTFNSNRSGNIGLYLLVGLVCVTLPYLIEIIGNTFLIGTKYQYIIDEMGTFDIGLGFTLALVPTFLPILFFGRKTDMHNKFLNVLLMVIPCRLAGYYSFFLSRMTYFFGIINVLAFPKIIEQKETKHKGFVSFCIAVCCLVYFLVYYCWIEVNVFFPYVTFREIEFKW